MAIIARTQNVFGYRVDDHGDTVASATALTVAGNLVSGSGIITTTADLDYFSFSSGAGQITVTVSVPDYVMNLDARLELRSETGTLIAFADPSTSFGATITANLAAGSYRLVVASHGLYGDVGQYAISGTGSFTSPNPSSPSPSPSFTPPSPSPSPSPLPIPPPSPSPSPSPLPSPSPSPSPVGDTTPPTVSITAPLTGSTVSRNTTVSIQASASDNVAVQNVQFLVNGTLVCTDTLTPYACSWKVPGAKNKTYTLTARATDTSNNATTSAQVKVTAQ